MNRVVTAVHADGSSQDVNIKDVSWRPSVYGVLIRDNKILLSPTKDGRYDLPGGGVDMHETLIDALVREIKEETGIQAKVGRLIAARDNFYLGFTSGAPFHSMLLYYVCDSITSETSTDYLDGNEVEYLNEAEWVDIERVGSLRSASSIDWQPIVNGYIQYGN